MLPALGDFITCAWQSKIHKIKNYEPVPFRDCWGFVMQAFFLFSCAQGKKNIPKPPTCEVSKIKVGILMGKDIFNDDLQLHF